MNNRFLLYCIFAFITVVSSFLMVCTDLEKTNPFDPDNPDYIKTQIEIIFDSTGIDSLFYTDTPIKAGIIAKTQEVMDRIQRVVINFGAGNEYTKEKPDEHEFLELWSDSAYTFATVDEKDIYVKVVTVNGDDILDSIFITIHGRGALISTHPQVFSEPFYKKDSLYLSVGDSGTAPITYQWFKDSLITDTNGTTTPVLTPLTGKEQSALIIPVLGFSDSGSYYCGVYNIYGGDTSNASLIRVIPQPPDSNTPYVSFVSGAQQGEENIGGSVAIKLSKALEEDFVSVNVKVGTASSATAGPDFTFVDTVVHFNAGETIQNIDITVIDDDINESNETVILDLVSVENGILGILNSDSTIDSTLLKHTYTIVDNDESFVGFAGLTQSKSEGDTVSLSDLIKVVLSNVNQDETTVDYVVTDQSTATGSGSEADYTLHGSATLVFPPYDSIAFIELDIINDTLLEGDQSICFVLQNPIGGISFSGEDTACTYYILDDDIERPVVSFKLPSLAGLESLTSVNIPVSLSSSPQQEITVSYVVDQTSSAVKDKDFALTASTLVFAIGDTATKNIVVSVTDDQINEYDETVILDLITVTNAVLHATDTRHTYTITDNDQSNCGFSSLTYTILETDAGIEKDSIEVLLSTANEIETTVSYGITSSTAEGSGKDFTLYGTGTLTFPPDIVKQHIILDVVGDTLSEGDEDIVFALSNPTGGITFAGQDTVCTYVIRDNDIVTISFDQAQTNSIDEKGASIALKVLLSKESQETVTVGYNVTGGTASGSGVDFTLVGSVLTFAPGELKQEITVNIVDDAIPEPGETLILELHTPSTNAALGTFKNFTLTILDDEEPIVSFQQTSVNKLETETSVTIPVNLSFEPQQQVSVPFSVLQTSTATAGNDYTLSATPLVFDAGPVTTRNIVLTVINDKDDEDDETVIIELGTPTNGILGTNTTHTHTINDDEYTVTFATTNGGTITDPATPTVVVSRDETISPVADPAEYWDFVNWTSALTISNPTLATGATVGPVQSDGTVTANFSQASHTVTVQAGTGGSAAFDAGGTNASIPNGEVWGLDATPADHYGFVNWTSDLPLTDEGSAIDATVGPVVDDGTVTANFTIDQHNVSFDVVGNGTTDPYTAADSPYLLEWDFTGNITADPDDGWEFSDWVVTGGVSKPDGSGDFTVTNDGTVTAHFKVVVCTLNVSANNTSYGSATPVGKTWYNWGTPVSVTASPTRGCKFIDWSDGNSSASRTVNMTLDISLTANFQQIKGTPDVIYVDQNVVWTSTPAADTLGKNWFNACKNLQTALSAGANKEVWVAEGTYSPSTTTPFSPVSNSKVYGGFSAVEETRDDRDFVANRTILDAGSNANTTIEMDSKQKIHVDGFTLTGAKSNGQNIIVTLIQDSIYFNNCIINNNNVDAYGGATISSDVIDKVAIFINCVFTKIRAKNSAPIVAVKATVTFLNTIVFDNSVNANSGSTGGLHLALDAKAYIIHSAFVNNVVTLGSSDTRPNAIYKSSTPFVKSMLKIYNSCIWNDATHSENGRHLVNLVDSLANDEVEYSTLDTGKVRTKYFKSNGTTWEFNKYTSPNYTSLSTPGGASDEKWFTSGCGLIYSSDKPGVNDGNVGYVNYTWLQWDMRGSGFVRKKDAPDIGPYEKQ